LTWSTTTLFDRIRFRGDPLANPDSIVVSGHARFTVLTPRLVRMEWSETGTFEDRGTYAFPTRYTPTPPHFATRVDGDTLTIDTGRLVLRYTQDSKFTAGTLSIAFDLDGQPQTWRPGMPNPSNLRGTRRTLDQCEGDAALEEGLLSRAGWALFDDGRSVVFNLDDGWVAPRPDYEMQDWYFFGYGHDYKEALADYTRFGGPVPLIPRFVLGAWWSRFWAYSAQDLQGLVRDFAHHDLPLDVLVVDMDWHTPHAWTGYTWNRALFPDPPAFLAWVHDEGLRVTLNLHPAQGVQSFEEIYPRFAGALGVDPATGQAVPFRITDKRFVKHYFGLLHHPLEDDGVDFWWMDWQQGEASEMRGLDPLPWLNHLHFHDSTRRGRRPMLYSRWGGLGNHRYYIGFSGDTYVGWPALQFQPYFTAAASNVAYGWWSHDIGGHMGGATEPELFARWVQFGALSPCLRLHSTKDPRAERRPWKYPDDVYQAAKAAFHLRYQLVPYLYTMARLASDTGLSLCRPLYYEHPDEDAAYAARYQYYFGDRIIAAPIVHPADPRTGMAAADVWIPEGTWIDYTTKETFTGPRWVRLVGDLHRVPMLVKEGAILPLAPLAHRTDALPHDRLILSVFPGAEGRFRLYEDDGLTEAYKAGQCEWTEIRTRTSEDTWTVEVAPVAGHCDALPGRRQYEIRLEGSHRPRQVTLDGVATADWAYDPQALATTIRVPLCDKRQPVTVTAVADGKISALGEPHDRQVILSDVRRLLGDHCPRDAGDVDAVLRADAPGRADAVARLGGPFVRFVELVTPEEASQHLGYVIVGGPARADEPYDVAATFTLFRGSKEERRTAHIRSTTEPHILDVPFAFDGQVQAMRWEAEVKISWRGATLVYTHQSKPLFPTIYAWRALVYNRDEHPLTLDQVMDAEGRVDGALGWRPYVQTSAELANVNQPHAVLFFKEYRHELQAGQPLAGFLTTTVVSPDEREAIVQFRFAGLAGLYLNGQEVEQMPVEEEEGVPPFFRGARQTAVIHLRAGKNTLVVDTRPSPTDWPVWFFGGAFTTPGGDLMTDLAFA
jgi:alpha-glucosidase